MTNKSNVTVFVPLLIGLTVFSSLLTVTLSIRPHSDASSISLEVIWQETFWDFDEGGFYPFRPITIGDVDGDGLLEAIICDTFRIIVINCDDGTLLWKGEIDLPIMWLNFEGTPILFDVDGDGILDIILAFHSLGGGWFFAVRGLDGTLIWMSELLYPGPTSENFLLTNLNNDDEQEIVFGRIKFDDEDTSNATVFALNPLNGEYIMSALPELQGFSWFNGLAVEDLDEDGFKDIVCTEKRGDIVAYSFSKKMVLWQTNKVNVSLPYHEREDVGIPLILKSSDGKKKVLIPMTNSCYCFDGRTGEELWCFRPEMGMNPYPLVAGDLNNDGKIEIIVESRTYGRYVISNNTGYIVACGGHCLYVVEAEDGRLLWVKQFPEKIYSPTLMDCDGDGVLDIVLGTMNYGKSSPSGNLYILRGRDGKILTYYQAPKNGNISRKGLDFSPIIADLDNDGIQDILAVYFHGPIVALRILQNGERPKKPLRVFWPCEGGSFNRTYNLSDIDSDYDGLSIYTEEYIGTDSNSSDTDSDLLPDGFEYLVSHTDPTNNDTDHNGVYDNLEDPDKDGLNTYQEWYKGTNPCFFDTDSDLLPDGYDFLPNFADAWFYYSIILFTPSILSTVHLYKKRMIYNRVSNVN